MLKTVSLNNLNLIYEQNYTQIPNVIFDYWMEVLTPAEFKVLCCIARKIFGWHKSQDKISLKQIQKMTCLSRQGVIKAISKLIEYQLVMKISSFTEDGDQAANLYTIHVHCIGGGSQLSLLGVVNSVDQGVVNSVDPQKKDSLQETTTTTTSIFQQILINEASEVVVGSSSTNGSKAKDEALKPSLKSSTSPPAVAGSPSQPPTQSKAKNRVDALMEKVDSKFDAYIRSEAKKAISVALQTYSEEVVACSIEELNVKEPESILSVKGLFPVICNKNHLKGPRKAADATLIEKRKKIAKCLEKMVAIAGGYTFDDKKLYVHSGASTKEYTFTGNDSFWEKMEEVVILHVKRSR